MTGLQKNQGREQTKSSTQCKTRFSSYMDCVGDRQAEWKIGLKNGMRFVLHRFGTDVECEVFLNWIQKQSSRITDQTPKRLKIGQRHWQDSHHRADWTVLPSQHKTFLKHFHLKGSLSHQLFCSSHKALNIELLLLRCQIPSLQIHHCSSAM